MNTKSGERTGFRSDINGLRAWAVVAVVLYHFGIPGFSGGFVGVDVFLLFQDS
jgi:peptidoglycan/LPS O-acetylase OafA/YrhL